MTLFDEWIEKAEGDYKIAVTLNRPRKEPLPDGVCYHCQQSAEKYLKAYLVYKGATPTRTHDLLALVRDCAVYDPTLSTFLPLADALNPYSVQFRYPGVAATVTQAKDALAILRQLRRTLRKNLGL